MSAPLDFLKIFAGQIRSAGIRFAITSGMACVHYGLQQTTKDSDWIIAPEDMGKLRELLSCLEQASPAWRISYRSICGAPLDLEYIAMGWTSHLSVWDGPASPEHKVDIFGKPPRVRADDLAVDAEGWATRHVVAQMKRTDRPKDWPIVHGLGRQLGERGRPEALLHLQEYQALISTGTATDPATRARLALRRPLLRVFESPSPPVVDEVERLLLIERLIWECVNAQRHGQYTRAWKEFFRSWRKEDGWIWPTQKPFLAQHQQLLSAARAHRLQPNPLASLPRHELLLAALTKVANLTAATQSELDQVCPPLDELLP
ncbi:MAG: hypothetical protein HY735_03575 [Verrucomicrobia bacterium]|nr:hypothetical protein [Verrucomicrobiota bacterium]